VRRRGDEGLSEPKFAALNVSKPILADMSVAARRRSQWQTKFRKDFVVKGAKRRLRRSKTLDDKIFSKHTPTIAIDGFS
jgi:phage gp16-like protein